MTDKTMLAELERQQAEITRQIEEIKNAARREDLLVVREYVKLHGFTWQDISPQVKTRGSDGRTNKKIAPKYRNPENGTTWSGRGVPPTWIRGKDYAQFLIPESEKTAS